MNAQSFNVKQYFLGSMFLLILYDLLYKPAEIAKYLPRACPRPYKGEILDRSVIDFVLLQRIDFKSCGVCNFLHILNSANKVKSEQNSVTKPTRVESLIYDLR